METEDEPEHAVVDGGTRALDTLLCANVAFAEYSCETNVINFKDTLMLQTRIYE